MSWQRTAYRGLTTALSSLLPLWLKARASKGKEDPLRLNERFGHASEPRPEGELIWMHGASIGEVTMLLPLITALLEREPKTHVLITSGTVTSAQILAKRLPSRAVHQYAPLDTRASVKRFLGHWKPNLAIWAESEIWPNLVLETKARGIPMALINARMSEASLKGWSKRTAFAQEVFSCFDYIQPADTLTAQGMSAITKRDLRVYANLKEAADPLPFNAEQNNKLSVAIGQRPSWCAASTHKGEDEIILRAHKQLLKTHPEALLILAPRHPDRREDILALAKTHNFTPVLHSRQDPIKDAVQIYIVDTIGDMGLAFILSDVTMMCGSLRPDLYGHNPLEPARHRSAVLTGPNFDSFKNIYEDMFAFGAAVPILEGMSLARYISHYFNDAEALLTAQSKAYAFAQSRSAILDVTIDALTDLMNSAAKS